MKAIGTLIYLILTIGFALGALIAFAAALFIGLPIGGAAAQGNAQLQTIGVGAILSILAIICFTRLVSISSKNKLEQNNVKPSVVPSAKSSVEIEQPKVGEASNEEISEPTKSLSENQKFYILLLVVSSPPLIYGIIYGQNQWGPGGFERMAFVVGSIASSVGIFLASLFIRYLFRNTKNPYIAPFIIAVTLSLIVSYYLLTTPRVVY